jgi:hypothetical protein
VKSKFEYRGSPTSSCPYLLETTPEPHYVSSAHMIIETVLINRFGKKNIPFGNFWRLADTSKEVYGAQKYLWPVIKRLEKTYDGATVLAMVRRHRLKFLTPKLYGKYLYWCKEEKDLEKRREEAESRYYKDSEPEFFNWTCPNCGSVHNQDTKHCPCKAKTGDNLLDWLDS